MEKKTYIIEYKVYNVNNSIIKQGKMKCKNRLSELDAKCSLEKHLKLSISNFSYLVIDKCEEDSLSGLFGDIFGNNTSFNNIFKGFK